MNCRYQLHVILWATMGLFAGATNALANDKVPENPAELLSYLRNSMWVIQSDEHPRYGNGAIIFRKNGVVEHIYDNEEVEKKSWGVTDDMKVVWGGGYLRVITFSDDYQSFTDSKFGTSGRRIAEHKRGQRKKKQN